MEGKNPFDEDTVITVPVDPWPTFVFGSGSWSPNWDRNPLSTISQLSAVTDVSDLVALCLRFRSNERENMQNSSN